MKINEFLVEQESKLSKEQNITQDCFNITRARQHKKPRQAKSETGKIKKEKLFYPFKERYYFISTLLLNSSSTRMRPQFSQTITFLCCFISLCFCGGIE